MRIEDLIAPIRTSAMSYENLLERVRKIRHDRANYVPVAKKKAATKSKAVRKSKVDKLLEGMSKEERLAFVEILKEGR